MTEVTPEIKEGGNARHQDHNFCFAYCVNPQTNSVNENKSIYVQLFDKYLKHTKVLCGISGSSNQSSNSFVWETSSTSGNSSTCIHFNRFSKLTKDGENFVTHFIPFKILKTFACLAVARRDCTISILRVKISDRENGCENPYCSAPHLHLLPSNGEDAIDTDISSKQSTIQLPLLASDISVGELGNHLMVSLLDYSILVVNVALVGENLVAETVRRIDAVAMLMENGWKSNTMKKTFSGNFNFTFKAAFCGTNSRRINYVCYPSNSLNSNSSKDLYIRTGSFEMTRLGDTNIFDDGIEFAVQSPVVSCCFSPMSKRSLALICRNGCVVLVLHEERKNKNRNKADIKHSNVLVRSPSYICWHPNESCIIAFSSATAVEKEFGEFNLVLHQITVFDLALQPIVLFKYGATINTLSINLIQDETFREVPTQVAGNINAEAKLEVTQAFKIPPLESGAFLLHCESNGKNLLFPFSPFSLLEENFGIGIINARTLMRAHLFNRTNGIEMAGKYFFQLLKLHPSECSSCLSLASPLLRKESKRNTPERDKIQHLCREILRKLRETSCIDGEYYEPEDDPASKSFGKGCDHKSKDTKIIQLAALERRYFSQLVRLGQLENAFQFAQYFAEKKLHRDAYIMFNELAMWSNLWNQPMLEKLANMLYSQEKQNHDRKCNLSGLSPEKYSEVDSIFESSTRTSFTEANRSFSSSNESFESGSLSSSSNSTKSEVYLSDTIRSDPHEYIKSNDSGGLLDLQEISCKIKTIGMKNTKQIHKQMESILRKWEVYLENSDIDKSISPLSSIEAQRLGIWLELKGKLNESEKVYSLHGLMKEKERLKALRVATSTSSLFLVPYVSYVKENERENI